MIKTIQFWLIFAAISIGLVLTIWFLQDPFGWQHRRVENLQNRVTASTQQATLAQATTNTVEHVYHETTVIREHQDAAVQLVQAAPGADDSIPPDVRSAWRAGIDSERNTATSAPADRSSGQPPF